MTRSWLLFPSAALLIAACGGGHTGDPADAFATTVAASVSGSARPLPAQWLGVNGNALMPWCDPDFRGALPAVAPQIFRYPGGTTANYWNWRTGKYWPSLGQGHQACPNYSLELMGQSMQAAGGATVIYNLNLMTWQDQVLPSGTGALDDAARADALALLGHGVDLGMTPLLAELGNEFNLGSADHNARFVDGADYGRVAQVWIDDIHASYPGAKVAIVGSSGAGAGRRMMWNGQMFPVVQREDAVTLHTYLHIADEAGSTLEQVFPEIATDWADLDATVTEVEAAAPDVEIWLTEFNVNDETPDAHLVGHWAQALELGLYLQLILGEPAVTRALVHGVARGAPDGMLYSGVDELGNGMPTVPWQPTAQGHAFAMLAAALDGADSAQAIAFAPAPELSSSAGTYPALTGTLFTGARRGALILNVGSTPLTVTVGALLGAPFEYEQRHASLADFVTGHDGEVTIVNGQGQDQVVLPPYSITRLWVP